MNTGYLLMNVSKKLRYRLNQQLVQLDLTAQQWAVIQQLHQMAHQAVSAQILTERLDMDKPTISAIIKRLELKDILYRKKNTVDSRVYDLFLTAKGQTIFESARELSDVTLTEFLARLSETQQQELNQLLQKLEEE
ncbi:hypothetical protein RU97_GL001041 [Enterococcus canis]|uniref:HTH marR-type domain-containing protein n=1 Tax=Enterococcus canis TaxID=214095 RepID=A0A1L8RI71_9ENTE|nr:MarR family transcriptional regulator [Enterococcus canis]OJG19470.1 hypothetical protein RU97_GL001041 [Enterococcus canis]